MMTLDCILHKCNDELFRTQNKGNNQETHCFSNVFNSNQKNQVGRKLVNCEQHKCILINSVA